MSDDDREPVGSLAEEAAKLLGALQGWARETGQEYAGAAGSTASGASGLLEDVNEHIATGGQDCTYCPVCRVIAGVRGTSPEVKEHLAAAATSLMQAALGFMGSTAEGQTAPRSEKTSVEHIDLTEGDDWEDD